MSAVDRLVKTVIKARNLILVFGVMAVLSFLAPSARCEDVVYSNQIWDFGYVGIDFKVFHSYWIANEGSRPVRIKNIDVSCECSKVRASDTIIAPGDTVYFRLSFETKNYYGPTNRSFKVSLDSDRIPELQFHYLATVGQWFHGLKPNPISVFLLPAHQTREISINNSRFDQIRVELVEQADSTFTVNFRKDKADKGESVVIEISPSSHIGAGTYQSNLTLRVHGDQGQEAPLLTIPVKIVRY